jgi:amidase
MRSFDSHGADMEEYTISELQSKMQAGALTARKCVELYFERIQSLDALVGSISELNPDVLDIADELDAERIAGKIRGPLHGIPILLKENIDTADKMQTTAGSLALQGNVATKDAFLVKKLREAGAIILGKTNLSEWANFRSTHSSSGWSSRGGLTKNPYALDRSACGSSSGSAVAVAANFCSAAVGTETDGSVICPAQTNGIVGMKPTLGLISRSGIIPIAHSQDTAGPMARTVADVAAILTAMSGPDEQDVATPGIAGYAEKDYTSFLKKDGLRGARIGVSRNYWGFDTRVDEIMDHAIDAIRALGAEIFDPANVSNEAAYEKSELEVLLYEFHADLDFYLASHPGAPVKSMKEIITFNEQNKARMMPYFGQERMQQAVKKGPLSQLRYLKALEKNQRLSRDGIDQVLEKNHLDAIIAPTGGPAWMIDLVNGDNYRGGGFSSPAAVAGYPHITVPAGYIFGLPVGLSFFGTAWKDAELVQYAYAFEQATNVRKPPKYLSTVDLTLPG